jgi:hypothetical protein
MRRVLFAFAALVLAAVAAPVIVIHTQVSEPSVLHGTEVKITTTASNVGDEPANDFILEHFETKTVESLGENQNVTIVHTISAANLGALEIPKATATWAVADESVRRRATGNEVREEERDEKRHAIELGPRGFVNVIGSTEYDRLNSRFIKETILYIIFAAVVVGFPFGVYRQKQVQVEFHLKESRKK